MVTRPHIDLRALIALSLSILLLRSSASAAPSRSANPEVETLRKQVEKSRIEAKRANAAHAAAIGRLNTSAGAQAGRINTLEQRISAAADTQSRLTAQSETQGRTLQNISQQLNTQINDRTTVINDVIHESTVGGTIAGAIRNAKDDVTAASVARDTALQDAIRSEAAFRTAAVNAESTSRTSAIATAISSEVTARNTAITTAVNASTQTLEGRIAAEATARVNGDTALNAAIAAAVNASTQSLLGNIAAEAAARERAVNATNGALTTERNERLSGQQTLTNTANSIQNDLTAERAARIGTDNTHTAGIAQTQNAIAAEREQRIAADGAEGTARNAAILAREQAITAAYTARVNDEGAARVALGQTLSARIGAEEIARGNTDTSLSNRITAEVGNSQARDTALGNTISSTSAQLTTDYRAAISQAIAADIAPEAARITAAITNQAVNPLSATVIPAQIAASRAAITSDYTAAIGQFQSSVISDYGLPPQEITVSAAAPHPGSAVGPTDYYCQMVNLAGYLDDGDRTVRVSLTAQRSSINTAANVYLGQADLRSAEVVLHLEDPTFSGRTPDDRRRSASVIVNGPNVVSRNLLAGSTYEYFSYLLGANGDTLTTFLGAQVGDGALPFGSLSYAQNRKFGVELLSGSNVIARLVNGVPLKPGTTDPNNANNFGCANVSISAADRALVMDHGNIFKDPNAWLLQIRGDYAGKVLISTR